MKSTTTPAADIQRDGLHVRNLHVRARGMAQLTDPVALLQDRLANEAVTMRMLRHPNILPLESSFVEGEKLWLVTPYCAGGSVSHLLEYSFPQVMYAPRMYLAINVKQLFAPKLDSQSCLVVKSAFVQGHRA